MDGSRCHLMAVASILSLVCLGLCGGDKMDRPEKRLVIQSLEDDIGAGNFTYFRLQRPGCLRIELNSISGDVDIYASTEAQHPDYENYEMKSETCGLDVIAIPTSMSRPVYISLFGHPNNLLSHYQLTIVEVDEVRVDDYESLVNKYERYFYDEMESDDDSTERSRRASSEEGSRHEDADDDLPLWWKILLGFIEFGLEVVL